MARSDRKRSRSRSPSDRRSNRRSRSPEDHSSERNSSRNHSRRDKERDRDRRRDRSRSPHRSSSGSTSHSSSSKRPRESSGTNSNSANAPNREKLEDIVGRQSYKNFDMEKQNELLDKLMQERRERVEKWRSQQKLLGSNPTASTGDETNQKEVPPTADCDSNSQVNVDSSGEVQDATKQEKKKWSLDDELDGDDDDDEQGEEMIIADDKDEHGNERELLAPKRQESIEEDKILQVASEEKLKSKSNEQKPNRTAGRKRFSDRPEGDDGQVLKQELDSNQEVVIKEETKEKKPKKEKEEKEEDDDDDEIDPLDAYMMSIQEEVKKNRKLIVKNTKESSKVSVIVGIAKRKSENKRGELLEQNEDGIGFAEDGVLTKEDELANVMDSLNQAKTTKKPQTISLEDITYLPFRKNFYIEVPEIARMSQQEVDAMKEEMEGIKTKGKGCPRPIRTWAQCGVSKKVLEILKKSHFEKPTPIQCQAIPVIMSGRDMIGIAKTGSGKTLAFLLPMFRHILDQPPLEPGDGPIAIIMTPTRELAVQIYIQCRKFAKPMGLRTVAVYGGTPISEQIGDLKPGTEIVVCTPGRMIDMLAANSGRVTNLRRCTYIVLDEADRMFDMGFEPQVMRIIDGIRPDRQTVMFSATFPRIMEALARRILDRPIEVLVGGRSIVCKDIEQHVCVIDNNDKFLKLLEILGKFANDGSAICFVDKQEHADMLLKELMHASYTVLALHGGIDQSDRDSTIADFKAGKVNVLVATSVAARGLDVKHCIVVVNYDCPNHYEDYVHRCGRTGRAGNKGYAYTFITPEQGRYSVDLIKALQLSETEVPEDLQKLYDEYKAEQEALGKKVKSSSGFSGKGFKFDEAEAAAAVEKKKAQKAALGLQDSDDEDEEGEKKAEGGDIDAEIESKLGAKKKAVPVVLGSSSTTSAQANNTSGNNPPAAVTVAVAAPTVAPQPVPGTNSTDKSLDEKMEQVRKAASKISMLIPNLSTGTSAETKAPAASHTAAILKGDALLGDISSAVNAKSIAEQRAEALNAKLNYAPKDDQETAPPVPVTASTVNAFQRYEAELEINDFPQQARWRVTGKETIAQISEVSEAGITVRGSYFPQGKEPGLGERKLYLAIEAMSERAIDVAKGEIIRIIKEEISRASNTTQQFKGRYKVL